MFVKLWNKLNEKCLYFGGEIRTLKSYLPPNLVVILFEEYNWSSRIKWSWFTITVEAHTLLLHINNVTTWLHDFQVVHSLDLSSLVCASSRLQYLLVDYCSFSLSPWVYVSDASTRTIIVYDVAKGNGHRVVLPDVVEPVGSRDVLYMTLIRRPDQPSRIYFTYLSSNR